MMKLTLKQLLESAPALFTLAANEKIPAKPSYWIGKAVRKAEGEMKDYNEARVKLCESMGGVLNDKADKYDIPPENVTEFGKQHDDLLTSEIELPGDGIKLDSMGESQVAPGVMAALDWLITE